MERTIIQAGALPALVWGRKAASVVVAVHGNQSNREDRPIEVLAEVACARGWQVLSYDLPEHGARKGDPAPCRFAECVSELVDIVRFARERWTRAALFGVSMGASFALLGCGELLDRAWFLSPVTDMLGLTRGMMAAFGVSEAELEERRAVPTPIGQTIYLGRLSLSVRESRPGLAGSDGHSLWRTRRCFGHSIHPCVRRAVRMRARGRTRRGTLFSHRGADAPLAGMALRTLSGE